MSRGQVANRGPASGRGPARRRRPAWDDGVITHEELADLRIVGDILDISQEFVTPGLAAPVIERDEQAGASVQSLALAAGEKVVFAGDMSRDREDIENDLRAVANSLADLLRISPPRNNQPLPPSSERPS